MPLERLARCALCRADRLEDVDPAARIQRCASCGYVFDNPRPTADAIARFYSARGKYGHWVAREEARAAMWRRRIRKLRAAGAGGALLDVGAGIGEFLEMARPSFASVEGTEVSREAVEVARARHGVTLHAGEMEGMRFGRRFDTVTLFHVLEHVPDPRRTLERCRAVLRPGGLLVVAVPNDVDGVKWAVRRLLRAVGVPRFRAAGRLGLPPITLDAAQQEVHLSHFTAPVLARLLTTLGFTDVRVSQDPYHPSSGLAGVRHRLFFAACDAIRRVTGRSLYDALWITARRPAVSPRALSPADDGERETAAPAQRVG